MKNSSEKNGKMARKKFFMCFHNIKKLIEFNQMVHFCLPLGTSLLKTIFFKISYYFITTVFIDIVRHYKTVYLSTIPSPHQKPL